MDEEGADVLDLILGKDGMDDNFFGDNFLNMHQNEVSEETNIEFNDDFWKSFLNDPESGLPNSLTNQDKAFAVEEPAESVTTQENTYVVSELPIEIETQEVVITSDQFFTNSSNQSHSSDSESLNECQVSPHSSTSSVYEEYNFCKLENTFNSQKLTEEEKHMMQREGLNIPNHLPLTKQEERDLKRIRRKIRNKKSAQDSRKRKKQYVDGLEVRVRLCTAQNAALQKRVNLLERQNVSLLEQLKQFRVLITSSAKPAKTSTCIMVLILSFALLALPNIRPSAWGGTKNPTALSAQDDQPPSGMSRNLLYTVKEPLEESLQHENLTELEETLMRKPDRECQGDCRIVVSLVRDH